MKTRKGRIYLWLPDETLEDAIHSHKMAAGQKYFLGFTSIHAILKHIVDQGYGGPFKVVDYNLNLVFEAIKYEPVDA